MSNNQLLYDICRPFVGQKTFFLILQTIKHQNRHETVHNYTGITPCNVEYGVFFTEKTEKGTNQTDAYPEGERVYQQG